VTRPVLRPARPDDLDRVADLSARSLRDDLVRLGVWSPGRLRAYVERRFSPDRTLVVELDGEPVGSVSVREEDDATWFELFYLEAAVQGRGVGTAVLGELVARHGHRPLRIDVVRGSRARTLYERQGFVHEGGDATDEIMVRDPLLHPVLRRARADEFEALLALKERALRGDLERLGIWDPENSRAWASRGFSPAATWFVELDGVDVGSVSARDAGDATWIELFYLEPAVQGRGLGTVVLREVLARVGDDATVRLDVLLGSRARTLYLRHGFEPETVDGVDEVLVRHPRVASAPGPAP